MPIFRQIKPVRCFVYKLASLFTFISAEPFADGQSGHVHNIVS